MTRSLSLCTLFTVLGLAATGSAHTRLISPNGGESLRVGTQITIEWERLAKHDQRDWDLWYSTTGDTGPWIPIQLDMPVNQLSLVWRVPDTVSNQVRFRIRQHNTNFSYVDISDADSAIIPSLTASGTMLSLSTGGKHTLSLDADVQNANLNYWVVGSMTGTNPGTRLGAITVPIVYDLYSVYTIHAPNSSVLRKSLGKLDAMGQGEATFHAPTGPLSALLIGFTFHHCFIAFQDTTIVMVSNPVPVKLNM